MISSSELRDNVGALDPFLRPEPLPDPYAGDVRRSLSLLLAEMFLPLFDLLQQLAAELPLADS